MNGRVAGLALGAAFVLAVLAGRLAVLGFVAVLTAMAAGEIYRLSRSRGYEPVPLVGLLGIGALLFAAHMRGDAAPAIFPGIFSVVIGASFIVLMVRKSHREVTRGIAFTMLPVLSVGLLGSFVLVVRGARDGTALALLFGAMIATAELGAWIFDRAGPGGGTGVGRPSWRRFGGAIGGSAIAGVIASLVSTDTIGTIDAAALGAVVGIAASTGELIGAMVEDDLLQEEAGVRRTPAGMLRRIDGALLGAPVFFYALRVLAR